MRHAALWDSLTITKSPSLFVLPESLPGLPKRPKCKGDEGRFRGAAMLRHGGSFWEGTILLPCFLFMVGTPKRTLPLFPCFHCFQSPGTLLRERTALITGGKRLECDWPRESSWKSMISVSKEKPPPSLLARNSNFN